VPTITTEVVQERVIELLRTLGSEADEIDGSTELQTLEVDSLDLVELGQIVEEEFDVELKSEDLSELRTVGDVVRLMVDRAS
jgi:acyl carrier protein